MVNSRWFLDAITADEGAFHSLKEILYTGSSPYQRIDVIRTGSYGKCLVIDDKIQSSEIDEFIYHEALVHPGLFLADSPGRVLIAGGGEGATAREALRHPSVSEILIVDLDREVVEVSKRYLPEWHRGAFEDKRVKVFIGDAREFMERAQRFDVILLDLPEPTSDGPALNLYTKEFYAHAYASLGDHGILVTQATSAAVNNLRVFTAITNTVKQIFPLVRSYVVSVPSFVSLWGFVLASKGRDSLLLSPGEIRERLNGLRGRLRFYDEETHHGMFSLPKYLRDAIEGDKTVITDSSPLSFY